MTQFNPDPHTLGNKELESLAHLSIHRSQLFFLLKLQVKPFNTAHLWGMGGE